MRSNLEDAGRKDDESRDLFGVCLKDRKGTPADMFGKPTLEAGGNGRATWTRSLTRGSHRVAWAAKLDAGLQSSWDDYAKVIVPVNEMPFTSLKSVRLAPYYTESSGIDMGVCIYMHDPSDFDNRIELSHTPLTNSAAGYRELSFPSDIPTGHAYFWYGTVTGTPSNCPTEGTAYTWALFQADSIFKNWTIYRISFDYGYYTGDGTMNACYLCQAQINDISILLEPSLEEQIALMHDEDVDAIKTVKTWKFGQPELRAANSGWAKWENKARSVKSPFYALDTDYNRQFRYGNWVAHLNGGLQSGDENWAQVCIPINDIPLPEFTEFAWLYYKFLAGTADLGGVAPHLVLQTRNPEDHDERSDISQQASHGAAITAGWHEDVVIPSTTGYLFWYGTGITSDLTEGSLYTLAQFQADKAFSRHTVYMLRIEYGYWGATRSAGDVWIGGVRVNGENIPMIPDEAQKAEVAKFEADMFGVPTLASRNNGIASWDRGSTSPLDQKGSTGWLARLYGGVQSSWDDWARVNIPVNEIPVSCFHTAKWSYYLTEAEAFGINMVIWVHDPYDFDIRAEITQKADIATLEKTIGWCAHELNPTTNQFYYYGEGIANTSLITGTGPGNLFGWDDFQGDERFNTMTIYRITFDYGWHSGDNEFKDAWVADISLNNQLIHLGPASGKHRKTVLTTKTLEAEAAYHAGDVLSESDTDGVGTDWDFDFGGTGYITKAVIVHATHGNTARVTLYLYDYPPTCELDDHALNTGPVTADVSHFLGVITFPAMFDPATADLPYAICTPSTVGGLPLEFNSPKIYAVAVTEDAIDFADDTLLSISLTADMEDN